MFEQAEFLEHDTDAAAQRRQLVTRQVAGRTAEKADFAPARFQRQIEEFQQTCLASTRRTGQEAERAGFQDKINIAKYVL